VPGGTTDQLARDLCQPVLVENRPGADTIIGSQVVAQAPADGHRPPMASGASIVLNPRLHPRPPYHVERDLTMLALIRETPLLMAVPAALEARDGPQMVALAPRRPLNFASVGVGNPGHLTAECSELPPGSSCRTWPFPAPHPTFRRRWRAMCR